MTRFLLESRVEIFALPYLFLTYEGFETIDLPLDGGPERRWKDHLWHYDQTLTESSHLCAHIFLTLVHVTRSVLWLLQVPILLHLPKLPVVSLKFFYNWKMVWADFWFFFSEICGTSKPAACLLCLQAASNCRQHHLGFLFNPDLWCMLQDLLLGE